MKTIKELQEELKKTKEDREFYFSKYYKLKEEKEKSERNKMINVQSEKDELSNQAQCT